MRSDGDCSKCKYRETCGIDRARMCAEMNADYGRDERELNDEWMGEEDGE